MTTSITNQHETAMFINRHETGLQLQMTLIHQAGVLAIGVYDPDTHHNPNAEPTQYVELSIDEARALRQLLNTPAEVLKLLQ